MNIKTHLNLLGMRVEDKVTGFTGIASSISFDLYGCVQVIVNPGLKKDGGLGEQQWFDANRLKVVSHEPVMERPDFDLGPIAEGKHGPAEKPRYNKT